MTPQRLSDMLMRCVYVPFAAAISVKASGEIIGLFQFDAAFYTGEIDVRRDAWEIWLMFNHPEGGKRLTLAHVRALKRICRACPHARVRLFLCGEDVPCCEVRI